MRVALPLMRSCRGADSSYGGEVLRLWGWLMVLVLGVSGCAGPGAGGAASPSPSSTVSAVPEDVKVCGFLKPSGVEEALGAAVYKYG